MIMCQKTAKFVWSMVLFSSMDINPLMDTYDGIGAPPYSPKMLLSLVVFAYINGVYSCRGIADALKYDVHYVDLLEASDCLSQPSTACNQSYDKVHQLYFDAVSLHIGRKGRD